MFTILWTSKTYWYKLLQPLNGTEVSIKKIRTKDSNGKYSSAKVV